MNAPHPRWAGLREAVHAEWTKLRAGVGTPWLLLLAAVASTAVLGVVAAAGTRCHAAGCAHDPVKVSLTGVQFAQAAVAVLAVLAIGGEYGTGMIRTTLAAMPRRLTVLSAKAVLVGVLSLGAGTVAVLAAVLAGRLILPGQGFTAAHGFPEVSLADGPVLRAAGGSVLYLVLVALLSLGVATALRDSAAAIGAVLGLLYLFPIVATVVTNPDWYRHLQQIGPTTAGLAVQATVDLPGLAIGPWAGLGVLAAWAAGALGIGAVVLRVRDA